MVEVAYSTLSHGHLDAFSPVAGGGAARRGGAVEQRPRTRTLLRVAVAAAAVAACVVLVLSVGGGAPARRASLAIVAEGLAGDNLLGQAEAEIEAEKNPSEATEEDTEDVAPTDPIFAQAQAEMGGGISAEPLGDGALDDKTKAFIDEAKTLGTEDYISPDADENVNDMSGEVHAYLDAIQNLKNETANLTLIASGGYGELPVIPDAIPV
mmetsp:Transcript_55851/g.133292  ORF Transcript_55851/g.133292 Transcript_55851/m.133292 type:complete len:210 (-) Transcript_55851:42-671(-)